MASNTGILCPERNPVGMDTGILCPERNPADSNCGSQAGVLGERIVSAADRSGAKFIATSNDLFHAAGAHAPIAGEHGASKLAIGQWSLEEKFADVLRRTAPKLPGELRTQFLALLTPVNLGIMVATLVAWAGSQFFGVGEIIDLLLLVVGSFLLGMAVFTVAQDLWKFLHGTVSATTEPDLDKAASSLAEAIGILGVAAFIALLSKMGAKLREEPAPSAADEPSQTVRSSSPRRQSEPTKPRASNLENSEFNGVTAERVRYGTNGKVAVIGRSMDKAVAPYARGLEGEGYNAETFEPSASAQREWAALRDDYPSSRIPDDVIPQTQMFKENQAWAEKLANQGYTVVDVGNPSGQGASPFYEMEKQVLFSGSDTGAH